MSNLVTPMLTSVDKSPVEYFSSSIRYDTNKCAILRNSIDHPVCLTDEAEWDDLQHLVHPGSSIYNTSTPISSRNIVSARVFSNNSSFIPDRFSNAINVSPYTKSDISDASPCDDTIENSLSHKLVDHDWKQLSSENNSCSKACVNINMGYIESSIESMVSNKHVKKDFPLKRDDQIETNINRPSAIKMSEITNNITATPISPPINKDVSQIKTFKNGAKVGHSRLWGSCGSAGTLQLNFEDKMFQDTCDNKPRSQTNYCGDILLPADIRNKGYGNSNKLKRISQVSFEAEFDSDGRTHEQITIDLRKIDQSMIAGQITLIELSYFKAIKAEEFLSLKWTGPLKHYHAPAIVASTKWSNQLNFWTQRIILEYTDLQKRTEMLAYFIRIIKKLVDMFNNLSSGMAMMCALQGECIHRLKQTWNNLSNKDKATFRRMEELFSNENNYGKLRDHITSLKLPCIPYIGLYLTDLTYINLAHSKLSEFESQTKTDQINNILRIVSEFQQSEYDISQNSNVYRYLESQRYIEELQKIIEDNNYRTSVALEPNVTEVPGQNNRQQMELLNTSLSPQKTPSYTCKHLTTNALQSPISPQPAIVLNESVKDPSDQMVNIAAQSDNVVQNAEEALSDAAKSMDESHDSFKMSLESVASSKKVRPEFIVERVTEVEQYFPKQSPDDDAVQTSLLCGPGRKSNYKKSKSRSIRLIHQPTNRSIQHEPVVNLTINSINPNATIDKDHSGCPSMSLLDDSLLDGTMPETSSEKSGQVLQSNQDASNNSMINKQTDYVCSPPICRCKLKGDIVDLKPKSTTKRKMPYSKLENIAVAADSAAQFSMKPVNLCTLNLIESEYSPIPIDNSPTSDDPDSLKLICQGILSRKTYMRNAKKLHFSVWNRYWLVLVMSETNAYLVYFENFHLRALDRKHFKTKECHVQDLRGSSVSLLKPSKQVVIPEPETGFDITDNSDASTSTINRFYLIDREYGTTYKFRDISSRNKLSNNRKTVATVGAGSKSDEIERCLQSSTSCIRMSTVEVWYRLLSNCINRLNCPTDDNKDLIVLSDS